MEKTDEMRLSEYFDISHDAAYKAMQMARYEYEEQEGSRNGDLVRKIDSMRHKMDRLEKEISDRRKDAKVSEGVELRLCEINDKNHVFNYKHRYIIKLLKFIDKIKLPRITIEWRR